MKFTKYHALGNDYLVINPNDLDEMIRAKDVQIICDRHYGIGSDGVLYGPLESNSCEFKLKIFNPDGSEAEKSGNGLRIFSRYLWDCGLVKNDQFSIETKGGDVKAKVYEHGKMVSVEMGNVRFTHESEGSPKIQVRTVFAKDKVFEFYSANVGNPHCVIIVQELSPDLAKTYGRIIEQDTLFKNRTNVQFMKVVDRNTIEIEIWERGAGYTLASGSSSTASAAVAYELGLCGSAISVHMPGGIIQITLNDKLYAAMKGAVCKIGEGSLSGEALEPF